MLVFCLVFLPCSSRSNFCDQRRWSLCVMTLECSVSIPPGLKWSLIILDHRFCSFSRLERTSLRWMCTGVCLCLSPAGWVLPLKHILRHHIQSEKVSYNQAWRGPVPQWNIFLAHWKNFGKLLSIQILILLQKVIEGFSYFGEVFNKPLIEISESEEASNLLHHGGDGPLLDPSEFPWIHWDFPFLDDHT